MKKIILIVGIVSSVLLTSCGGTSKGEESEEHGHEEGSDDHSNAGTVTLTKEQEESIDLELGIIEKKQLTSSLKANGLLKVPNQNKANITALTGGVIKSIHVQAGNTVKRGQLIATIANNSFIILQEDFITVSAEEELAQLELTRQKELQEGNAGALKNLQATESKLKVLKARKESLKKQLELIGINTKTLTSENIHSVISISSPINGTISNVMVNIGSYVDATNPIAEIVDNNQLHLDLFVYEKDLQKIREGQTIHFTLTNNPGKEYDADVYAISNTFEQNKAIAVHAIVKGDKVGLIDGMSITALISLENATVDAVPTDAIVSHEGQDYIFIVTDEHKEEEHHDEGDKEEHDEHGHKHGESEKKESEHKGEEGRTFEKIPVRKGTTDIGYSEITLLKEIPANSQIITKGAFFVLAKMNNKGEAHSH